MACPKFVDRKKSFCVVAIALGILILWTTIFALAFWELTSRNNQDEKNGDVFTAIFSVGTTSYEQKAEPSKVGTTTNAASTEIIPLHRDTLMPATSYEPKIESSKMKIRHFTSNGEKQLDEIACSHIDISSNMAMNEQYPKLFGAYERVGLINGRVMYRNPKTRSEAFYSNSIYHSNYHDNQKETEEYRSKWAVLFEDYLAFDINCNDIMPTNSNCNPEWRFCNASILDFLELKLDCVIVDTITFQCKNDSMEVEPIEDNQEICQELEFSSNEGIAKTVPELMGIYSLEDHLYNDMAVYVHKDMGFTLYYKNYSTDYQNSLIAINQKNQTWVIDNGTYLLADNFICTDTDLSMDGNCEFGWAYWNNDHRDVWIDWSASIICVKPSPVVTNIPTSMTCQTFQLMSTTAFELGVPIELYLLGEYVVTESTNNGMVVYRNRYTSYFLYFVFFVNTYGIADNYWAIGPEVGHEYANLFNRYCSNLENPANGNCKYGWFYFNAESKVWKYDMNMRIQCTNYSQNSIT